MQMFRFSIGNLWKHSIRWIPPAVAPNDLSSKIIYSDHAANQNEKLWSTEMLELPLLKMEIFRLDLLHKMIHEWFLCVCLMLAAAFGEFINNQKFRASCLPYLVANQFTTFAPTSKWTQNVRLISLGTFFI